MPAVCILGGGYAGLRVARDLGRFLDRRWSVTLVDRGEYHQLITRLPEVVAGTIPAAEACIAFTRVLNSRVQHLRAEVQSVDLRTRQVETSATVLRPEVLVVAVGTTPDFLGIQGAAEYTTTLKSVTDAVHLRDTIARLRSRQPVVRVVIVGAGYTGTEVAGELSALGMERDGSEAQGKIDVSVVAEDVRLLPQASVRVSAAVEGVLRGRRVPLNLGQRVLQVDAHAVRTHSGEEFAADLVVWAGQTHVPCDVIQPTAQDTANGKLRVDPYLLLGEDGKAFACGDVASIFDYAKGKVAASSAQLALQEGETVARNIRALVMGRPMEEYRPRVLGEALALGGGDAVAEIGGIVLSGRAAAAVKRAALVRYLGSLSIPSTG